MASRGLFRNAKHCLALRWSLLRLVKEESWRANAKPSNGIARESHERTMERERSATHAVPGAKRMPVIPKAKPRHCASSIRCKVLRHDHVHGDGQQ